LAGIEAEMNDRTKLVFICNPNNPTGAELTEDELKPVCQRLSEQCMVYVDEAYIEFSKGGLASSLASMTRVNRNLVVGRTFSKIYGLAGLRVGYAIGHPETMKSVRSFLQGRSITPSACSIAAASASLGDEAFMTHCREMNNTGKDMVYTALDDWGIEYIPSSTSFILFKTDKFEHPNIRKELQRKNILIRDYKNVPGWARVSIGTPDEMKAFVKATRKFLA
jgi:histidinol-phosphate aminotransferase